MAVSLCPDVLCLYFVTLSTTCRQVVSIAIAIAARYILPRLFVSVKCRPVISPALCLHQMIHVVHSSLCALQPTFSVFCVSLRSTLNLATLAPNDFFIGAKYHGVSQPRLRPQGDSRETAASTKKQTATNTARAHESRKHGF